MSGLISLASSIRQTLRPARPAYGNRRSYKMTDILEEQIAAIKKIYPSDIASVTVHDNGDDFFVVEVNHEWMFRFPRNEVSRKAMEIEKAFLARFKTISPLPVPDHQLIGGDFIGYPKIHGALLSLELFQSLSKRSRERIARQIGQFLSAVHNFPVDEAKRLGLTEGWNGWFDKIICNFREAVCPLLSPAAQKPAMMRIEQMLAAEFESRVIHGDFALEDHVFFDEERQGLSGVIDFADVTLSDPAHDFQNIVEYGGEEFFAAVMNHYRGRDDPTLIERTKLRIAARPMFEASSSLLFGFEERFKERMEYIEAKCR
jgi:aminoglycoside 2''-phosphotransferase